MSTGPNDLSSDALDPAARDSERARVLEHAALALRGASEERSSADLSRMDEDSRTEVIRRLAALRELHRAIDSGLTAESVAVVREGSVRQETIGQSFGRFLLRRRLGQGGQGLVFLAHDPALRRDVALKVPWPQILASRDSRDRFLREAQMLARVRHPNVVAVHDVGQVGEGCYIASEYCPGPNLAEWRTSQPAPPAPRLAAELMAQIAAGAAEAHRQGIVHRDLKPANVLLAPLPSMEGSASPERLQYEPRITDFGLARFTDDETRTQTGAPLGTAAYMAPEQAQGQRYAIGRATDVYALGVMLYELLSGELPHQGHSYPDTLRRIVYEESRPLRSLRPGVPLDLAAVCMKCLEKRPERRYPDASALEADLRRFLRGEPTEARPLRWPQRTARWAARRPALAALTLLCLLSALTIVSVSVWYSARLSQALDDARRETARANAETHQKDRVVYGLKMNSAADSFFSGHADQAIRTLLPYDSSTRYAQFFGPEWGIYQNLIRNHEPFAQHAAEAYAVAVSPDGVVVASGAEDGSLYLTDAESGKRVGELVGHSACVNQLSFSPDGSQLASVGCDGQCLLWELATRQSRRIEQSDQPLMCVRFSPSGRYMALGGAERGIQVFSTDTWDATPIGFQDETPHCVAWDPAERYLLGGVEDAEARVWAAPDWRPIHTTRRRIRTATFSLDGSEVLLTSATNVYCLETEHWQETQTWAASKGLLKSLAVNWEDRRFAVGGDDSAIYWIDRLGQGPPILSPGHRGEVRDLAYSPDGAALYSAGCDGAIKRWPTDAAAWPLALDARGDARTRYFFPPDGQTLWMIAAEGHALQWDLTSGVLCARRQIALHPGRSIIDTAKHRPAVYVLNPGIGVSMVDLTTGEVVAQLPLKDVETVLVSDQGRLLAQTASGTRWLIDSALQSPRPLPSVSPGIGRLCRFIDGPNPRALVQTNRELILFDLEPNRELWRRASTGPEIAYSPALGLIAVNALGPEFEVLRASDGSLVDTISTNAGRDAPLAFSADGSRLVIAGFESIQFWDLATHQQVFTIPGGPTAISVHFAPNDQYFLARVYSDSPLHIQDLIWRCWPPSAEPPASR